MKKGFTLIELLAVIVILGIVVAIAIPGINIVINNSREKSVISEAQILHSAAIRKLAEDPNFDFSVINKNNLKEHLETDGSKYEDVYISKVGGQLTVGLKRYGIRAKSDANKTTTLIPHIAYEYDLSLGDGFINIGVEELNSQDIYVYNGTYLENSSKIKRNFSNPDYILQNMSPTKELGTELNKPTGIITVIATKFTTTDWANFYANSLKNDALINIPHFDILELKTTNLAGMFFYARNFNKPIGHWDVRNVNDFLGLFWHAKTFNQNISNWNTKNVKIMRYTFYYAYDFNSPLDNWDTSIVRDMVGMFANAREFNQSLNNFNLNSIVSISAGVGNSGMFENAKKFNQDLSGWDVSHIPEKPDKFDNGTSSWTLPKPIWGTNGGN